MLRCLTLPLSVMLASAAPAVAFAQTAYLEESGIVGQGKLLTISRLPTADANGKIAYYDGSITITVSGSGVPSIASSNFIKSKKLFTNHFIPGRYYIKYQNQPTQFGSLTEGVGNGGSTVWSLVMDKAANGAFPDQATWQTGTPAPDVAARLLAAKVVTDPDDSYGLIDTGPGYTFPNNGLLAAKQIGNNLSISSYTYINTDYSNSQGNITAVLCPDQACSMAPP